MAYFEITLDHYSAMYCAADTRENARQTPAAYARTWKAIYEMLKGEALLDRPRAVALMQAHGDADWTPLKCGEEKRVLEFRLRENEEFPRVRVRLTRR